MWQFYTVIPAGVDIPAGKKLCEKGDFRKIVQEDFCRDLARNAHISKQKVLKNGPVICSRHVPVKRAKLTHFCFPTLDAYSRLDHR